MLVKNIIKYPVYTVATHMLYFESKPVSFSWNSYFSFCALLYVRYCEYSGVHRADSRAEAPSHAVCSAVGTLCQPHCSLHTGRERSCHQVGAHRIMINAANSHLTAYIFAKNIHSGLHLFHFLSLCLNLLGQSTAQFTQECVINISHCILHLVNMLLLKLKLQ